MRKRIRSLLRGIVTALTICGVMLGALLTAGPAVSLTGETRLHDPSVIKVDGCYYGYSTGFENDPQNPSGAVTVHRTCDQTPATGWTKLGNTWSSTPTWITQKLGQTPPNIWAPDINYFDGQYHLYYGVSVWGTTTAVMGLLTSPNPAGPWTDQGMVTDVNYPIDPDVVRGQDNRLYVSWGSWTGGATYMHVLDENNGKLSTTDHNLWTIAKGVEGVSIVKNGDYFYMFGSEGSCCSGTNSTYHTTVARSTSVTGPYVDQTGVNMVDSGGTLALRGASPRVAAGGGDVYAEGSATFFAYHYYDAAANGRESLDIRPLSFNNGWPVLGRQLGKANAVIQAQHSSKCLDVWGLSTSDGAPVNQGTCNGGKNQEWNLQPSGGGYQLVNVNSGKCLIPQGASVSAGAPMVQAGCSSATIQQWTTTPMFGGYVTIKNVGSGLCLEVYGNSTNSGAAANQWTCNGGSNQRWLLG